MDKLKLDDALSSMTSRDLEELQRTITDRLARCALCSNDGAMPWKVVGQGASKGKVASLLICKPCFEKHRLPEGRSEVVK
jgi:predicted mannosyl-3-phosphoglycerate phosphatase (HAD superfamily)